MQNWRIVTALLLSLGLVGSIACNPLGGNKQETTLQLVEVARGDLTVTISGSGNIIVTKEVRLVFGAGGRLDRIFVQEGENVTKGQILARLETDALELALTQAQVASTKAQVAVTQAEVTLETAKYDLNQALQRYTWPDIKVAQAEVDDAEAFLQYALDSGLSQIAVAYGQARLKAAEAKLDAMIRQYDTEEVAIKKLQVRAAEQSLELARQSLELAGQSLKQARKQLDEATITAPFSGIVASVPADEKDTVSMTTPIVHLIDPSSMELKVQVDEIDIAEVQLEQKAIIEVDALPALPLEGRVNFISLLPTEEAGVTVYDVKIRFDVPEGMGLRVGMSATADIVTAERKDVLLVPDRAIKTDSQGNHTVEVMVNEQIVGKSVVTGISDGFQTEIVDGLEEGEVVIEKRANT